MIATGEGHEKTLACGIADELHGVLDRLCPSHVELDSPLETESTRTFFCQLLRQQDFFIMEVLAGQLRQAVELRFEGVDNRLVPVTEIDCRIPHLKIEIGLVLAVIEEAALTTLKEFWHRRIMHSISIRAVFRLFFTKFLFADLNHRKRFHRMSTPLEQIRSATSVSVSNGT